MPKLTNHHSQHAIKMLMMGDSGTGKTGSLAALAKDGYNVRILDFDNGLDILTTLLADDPAALERVSYINCTDKIKTTNAGLVIPDGQPTAFSRAMKALNKWDDGEQDLGPIKDWTSNDVLVVDSLTFLSLAVMRWHLFMVGRIGEPWQSDWGVSQTKVMQFIELLNSTSIMTNVIVMAHIKYLEISEGVLQGYPDSIGRAISPQIPRYFNTCVQTKIVGTGKNAKHKLRIVPDSALGLKSTSPLAFSETELALEDALPRLFKSYQKGKTASTGKTAQTTTKE